METPCSANECERAPVAYGLCLMHYKRWRRWGDPEVTRANTPAKLLARPHDMTDEGCWVMPGDTTYGKVTIGNRTLRLSRVAYEYLVGPIPDDTFVLHQCDNPPCFNPEHLYLGDHEQNMRDMAERRRASQHRRILTDDQVAYVRAALALGRTQTSIAAELGIGQPIISNIKRGKTYT